MFELLIHLLGIFMGSLRNFFDIIQPFHQSLYRIFRSDEPLTEVYCIPCEGTTFVSSFGTLVYCPIVVGSLLRNPLYYLFDEWMIKAICVVNRKNFGKKATPTVFAFAIAL